MSTDECLDVVKQLSEMGCEKVSLIGGEVFMRSDWNIIAKALTDSNIKVSIITNGYMFSDEIIETIKLCKIKFVAVSIDGPEEIHDKYRQKGSFNRAIEAIDTLTKNFISVFVITTLHSDNVNYLSQMKDILEEKRILTWQLQACSPMGNAAHGDISTEIDFEKVISFVNQNKHNPKFAVGIADNIGYYTKGEGSLRGNTSGNAFFLGCRAGLTSIGIDSIGNVRCCESMHDDYFIEGNLREKTLSDIWNAKDAFSYNRNFTVDCLTGKCKECEYGSRCAGGCRSYNFFTHNKLYESKFCQKDNY